MPTWELGRSFGVTHTSGSTILGGSGKEGLRPDGRLAGEQWLAMSGEHPPIHVKGPVLATRTGCGCSQSLVQEELSPSIRPAKHLVLWRAVAWLSPLAGGVGCLSPVESNLWTDLPRGGGASPCPPGNGRGGLAHAHEHCSPCDFPGGSGFDEGRSLPSTSVCLAISSWEAETGALPTV